MGFSHHWTVLKRPTHKGWLLLGEGLQKIKDWVASQGASLELVVLRDVITYSLDGPGSELEESFRIPREPGTVHFKLRGRKFSWAVGASLILADYHFRDRITITSELSKLSDCWTGAERLYTKLYGRSPGDAYLTVTRGD